MGRLVNTVSTDTGDSDESEVQWTVLGLVPTERLSDFQVQQGVPHHWGENREEQLERQLTLSEPVYEELLLEGSAAHFGREEEAEEEEEEVDSEAVWRRQVGGTRSAGQQKSRTQTLVIEKKEKQKQDHDSYTDKIVKTIPTEIVTAWLFIHELVAAANAATTSSELVTDPVYYIVLGLMIVFTFLHLVRTTRSEDDILPSSISTEVRYFSRMSPVRKRQIGLGTVAFVIWVLYLGGPFLDAGSFSGWYNPTVGAIFLALFTVAIPIFLPDTDQRGNVEIVDVRSKGALNDQYIVLENTGHRTLDISKWTVRINGETKYTFPSRFELQTGKRIILRGGEGEDTPGERFLGGGSLWKDGENRLSVRHDEGWEVTSEVVQVVNPRSE